MKVNSIAKKKKNEKGLKSIDLKLYGELKDKSRQYDPDKNYSTIFDILSELNIEEKELSHIFVNGKYCGPGKKIKDGDRVGLFPKKMGLLFIEIAKNNPINITVKFFANLQEYGPAHSIIDIPEGSTIKSILVKYNIPKDEKKSIILINGSPCYEKNFILNEGDIVEFFPPIDKG